MRRPHSLLLRMMTLALALGVAATRVASASPAGKFSPEARDSAPPRLLAQVDLLPAPDALKPGEFEWQPGWDARVGGPVTVMVNLAEQRAYVFRDGQRIGTSTVSSGKPGHETPTGLYTILQKQKLHHSNRYEDPRTGRAAPMPWMQRLSWEGVALHAGHVRAKPASHGCVRLPPEFAKQLYGITRTGDIVVVSQEGSVASLMEAGVNAPLALLLGTADSLHAVARKFLAESSGATAAAGSAPGSAARASAD